MCSHFEGVPLKKLAKYVEFANYTRIIHNFQAIQQKETYVHITELVKFVEMY